MVLVIEIFFKILLLLKWLVSAIVPIVWCLILKFFNAKIEVSELPSQDDILCDFEVSDAEVPSIFVKQDLLPSASSSNLTVYDDLPECEEPVGTFGQYIIGNGGRNTVDLGFNEAGAFGESSTDNLRQFEVYSNADMEKHPDSVEMSEDDDRHLEVHTESVPQGVILNSNVFLNNQQWNTLVNVSETTFYCAVCGVYCDETEHIKLDSHIDKLSKHKPLYKYDLSIVRKIDNYFHCGVCNVLFNESQNDEHFTSKDHEDKMLFAINKVSDIMYDSNIHDEKTDTYHFSAKAINNNNLDLTSSDDDDHDSNYNDYGNSYGGLKYVENDEVDEDDDDFYDNVEPSPSLEHSYASMARRPKTFELPKVLEIDIGNKKITVNYNSWNMVINPKPNNYYCMVCTKFGHIRVQAEHCRTLEHVERLAKCKIVDAYDMHLVRQVDDKLYHCGHCNNLQLIHEMIDHIETQHPNRHTNTDSPAKPSTPFKDPSKNKPLIFNDKENSKNGVNNSTMKKLNFDDQVSNGTVQAFNSIQPRNVSQTVGSGNLKMYQDMLLANSNIYDDIVICAYGKSIKISKMAYNILCARENDFYCGLCEAMVEKERIKEHVNDLQHLVLLQRTPFIEAFNIHLFRQIREALHCALCNVLIQLIPAIITSHKFEQKHSQRVLEAVSPISNEKLHPAPIKDTKPVPKSDTKPVKVATASVKDVKHNEVTTAKDVEVQNAEKKAILNTDNVASNDFVQVKNGVKESDDDDEDDSVTDEFDFEEHVYVKLGNNYCKITNTAYNTLVGVGDGTQYCFVCSSAVERELNKHVDSRSHVDNIDKCKFVEKYKEDLLRQIYLTYHCSICNVLVTRKQLNHHLAWPTHALQAENTRISGKQRKTDIKSGMKQYNISTVKENIYLNEAESKVKIHLNVTMLKENATDVDRKNKIIIFNDNVLKISFDAWHSLSEVPKGWKCKMCQCEFGAVELGNHIDSDWHNGNLEKFELRCSPALIRKINDTTLNCVMCNTEVSNKKHIILEHVQGKKHKKSLDAILEESSITNTYADCDENVLTL